MKWFYLFSDPLWDVDVAEDDDDRPGDEPDRVEAKEGIVKPALKTDENVNCRDSNLGLRQPRCREIQRFNQFSQEDSYDG